MKYLVNIFNNLMQNEAIDGRFYNEEIQKIRVDKNTSYRIEKVYRKRTKNGVRQILVKFIGDPKDYWIKETDIVN